MDEEIYTFGSFRLIPAQRMLLDNGKPLRPGSRGGSFRQPLERQRGSVGLGTACRRQARGCGAVQVGATIRARCAHR